MSITQKLTEEELALVEILRHPIWCGEFLRGYESDEREEWVYTEYQTEFICDFSPYVSICCARAVGKSLAIIDKLVWYALNTFWDETIVYTVPNRVHLEPVFLRLTRWFRKHPFLKYYTGRTGINSQTFTIKLFNNAVIDCRIAGTSGTGANVVGLHVPIIILDEAGLYDWRTWIELLPVLNVFQEGHQLIVSGVPTGIREKNVLYMADMKDDKFSKHRVSAHDNPRYTEEDEERNLKQYGGVEGEDYLHLVLGRHGFPTYSMFDRERMLIGDYFLLRGTVYGQKIMEDPLYLQRFFDQLPEMPAGVDQVIFGIDLGYTDPSIILVQYKTRKQTWRTLVRAKLVQVDYPTQEAIIDHLDTLYCPGILGIDEGSSGKAVIQHFKADRQYKRKKYDKRIVPVQFRSTIPIGYDKDGVEIKVRAKQLGMQLLQSQINNHKIELTKQDEPLISELERTIYKRAPSGELVFKTLTPTGGHRHAEDHNVAALLCFVLSKYLVDEASQFLWKNKVKLYRSRWI